MKFSFKQSSPEDTVFHKDAFNKNIGKKINVNIGGKSIEGTFLSARVAGDGKSVLISVEIEEM